MTLSTHGACDARGFHMKRCSFHKQDGERDQIAASAAGDAHDKRGSSAADYRGRS